MDNLKLLLSETKEKCRQQLDDIESSSANEKSKKIEKFKIIQRWFEILRHALNELREKFDASRETFDKLKQQLEEELDNDDSGVGEWLTITAQLDDNPNEFENNQIADANDDPLSVLEQLELEVQIFNYVESEISAQYDELQKEIERIKKNSQSSLKCSIPLFIMVISLAPLITTMFYQ